METVNKWQLPLHSCHLEVTGVLYSQRKELDEGQSEFSEPQKQSPAEQINASQRDT